MSAPETREEVVPSREYIANAFKAALAGRVPLEDADGTPNYVLIRVRDALAACALLAATPPAPSGDGPRFTDTEDAARRYVHDGRELTQPETLRVCRALLDYAERLATPPAPEVTEADEAWVYELLDREFGTERKEAYLRELAEHIFFHFLALRATRRESRGDFVHPTCPHGCGAEYVRLDEHFCATRREP